MRTLRPLARLVYVAVIASGAIAADKAVADEPGDATVITVVSVKDARDVLTRAGAEVGKADYSADGFTMIAALDADRHVTFEGMDCKGADEAMACPEFKITAIWQLDTSAHAEASVKKLGYNYISVAAFGNEVDLWRMDFISGGVTRRHFRNTVLEFLDLRQQAEGVIWPKPATPKSDATK